MTRYFAVEAMDVSDGDLPTHITCAAPDASEALA